MSRRIRKRIDRLCDAEREALRGAFRALMDDPDPATNYKFWVDIHANCCLHGSGCFLPWHRAYLFAFEDALRATSRSAADVTLPFWDWTTIREIPALVKKEPLTSQRNEQADPAKLPSRDHIDDCLKEPEFRYFGGRECCEPDVSGDLEDYHGIVHQWVGFTMTTERAPDDPLFWFHHSYVDKVWHDWYGRHQKDPPCPTALLQGIPGAWTVGDVLRIEQGRLGYEYEDVERFVPEFRFMEDKPEVLIPATADAITGHRRIRFDDVHPIGDGDPPATLEVRLTGRVGDPIAVVSLFGVDHGRGHARDKEGDGSHGHHHAIAPALADCKHIGGGAFAAPLRVASGTPVGSDGLTITAHWQPYSRHRAGLHVGSITVGEI